MKYIKAIIFFVFIAAILLAQDEVRAPHMPYDFGKYQINKNPQILQINSDKMLDSVITMVDGAYKKQTMTYNSKGAITSLLAQSISYTLNNLSLQTYEYDDRDRITSILSQRWDGGEWANVFRVTNTYDGLITELQQQWDASSNSWANYIRKIRSSDTSVVQLGQIWDWSLNDWKDDWRETKEYDGVDLIYSIYENWFQDEWKIQSRMKYKFDTRDNLVKDKYELWTGDDWWLYYVYDYAEREGTGEGIGIDTTFWTSYKYKSYAQTLVEDERQTCV